MRGAILASLKGLLTADPAARTKRYIGLRDGGGEVVEAQTVTLDGARVETVNGAIEATFLRDGGSVEVAPATVGLPVDWSDYTRLELEGVNASTEPVQVILTVVGARGRLIQRLEAPPRQAFSLQLDVRDLPLSQGNQPPHEPAAVRVSAQWGATWKTEAERLLAGRRWPATADNAPVRLVVSALRLVPRRDDESRAVADRFGQRIRGQWEGKIESDAALADTALAEAAWLRAHPPRGGFSVYGGWRAGRRSEASGFFRVEQDTDGRWWYIDPDGWPFWSIGATGVRLTDATVVAGREHLFEELPAADGPHGAAVNPKPNSPANDPRGRKAVAFYYLNVLRKWGSEEAWCRQVTRRFKAWGFNTIANWSQPSLLDQREVAHTRTLDSRLPGTARVAGRMPDVWDAGWRQAFDSAVAAATAAQRDNPWVLGYFCDNEMPWGGLRHQILDCPPSAAAREAFTRFMRARYTDLPAFNRDFATDCASWDAVHALTPDSLPEEGPSMEVMGDFVAEFADLYFRTVAETIARHAPNHLYLGCRFVRRRPEDRICAAAGRYAKAVTVNCYDLWPRREEFSGWYAACGRPIQIGEHHYPLRSERQLPPLYPAFTAAERRTLYPELVRKWAGQPYALGYHWFQHADQHLTGRPGDGENQTVGFVDITDRPHAELVEAALEATAGMYGWHAASE